MQNLIKTLADVVAFLLSTGKKSPHAAPLFTKAEIPGAVDAGKAHLFSWGTAFYGASSRSNLTPGQKHSMVAQITKAARNQHPHIYKFGLAGNTTNHLKALKAAYRQMASHAKHYLRTGLHKAYAADKNKPFKMDVTERKKLMAGIAVLTDSMKQKMDKDARKFYGVAYRKGKDQAVKKLGVLGQDTSEVDVISGDDLKLLNDWYVFHDEASDGLADDINERMAQALEADDYENEDDFTAKTGAALDAEEYRLPMYAWMAFPVAESAQIETFDQFNEQTTGDGGEEWKYKWITMMDGDVCPICEEYGLMEPRYLDEWPDEPGDVHVYCRCDLEPIPPAGGQSAGASIRR